MHCPVYEATHPWTQTFLDDETPTRTRPFLQTHLMACEPCQHSLDRARRFYYAVEAAVGAAVPGAVATGMRETGALSARENRERRARALRNLAVETTRLRAPVRKTFQESLLSFAQTRPEAWIGLAFAGFSLVYLATSVLLHLLK